MAAMEFNARQPGRLSMIELVEIPNVSTIDAAS